MLRDIFKSKASRMIALVAMAVFVCGLAACGGGGDTHSSINPGPGPDLGPGSGTEADPFLIKTPKDLKDLADRVNTGEEPNGLYYKLTNNIDLSGYGENQNDGKGWEAIGNNYFQSRFRGHFDGNGKTISNLFIDYNNINDPSLAFGLFGFLENGTVTNLTLENVHIIGDTNIGGVVGSVESGGIISNCRVIGTVSGNRYVGGVAGYINGRGAIRNCYATGTANGNQHVGGVVGYVSDFYSGGAGTISNCYTTSTVSGYSNVGGVAGYAEASHITGCAALNPAIERNEGSEISFGRVVGATGGVTLSNNVAFSGMTVLGSVIMETDDTSIHGADISKEDATLESSYRSIGFAFGNDDANPWKWGGTNYPLPVLYWQTGTPELPSHLK